MMPIFERSTVRAALNRPRKETFARLALPVDEPNAVQPAIMLPPELRGVAFEDTIDRASWPSTGRLLRARMLAFTDVESHSFPLRYESVRDRVRQVQQLWAAEEPVVELERLFHFACHERHTQPHIFSSREWYLKRKPEADVTEEETNAEGR